MNVHLLDLRLVARHYKPHADLDVPKLLTASELVRFRVLPGPSTQNHSMSSSRTHIAGRQDRERRVEFFPRIFCRARVSLVDRALSPQRRQCLCTPFDDTHGRQQHPHTHHLSTITPHIVRYLKQF